MTKPQSRPAPSQDFQQAADVPAHVEPEIDAIHWEPLHDHDELNFDPPHRVYDPEQVMAPTPFGSIEVDVQRQLDPNAQRAIHEAQQREPEQDAHIVHEMDELDDRDVQVAIQDDFERRLAERFRHAHEHELER